MASADDRLPSCPIPLHEYPNVLLAHGGGGSLMKDLIDKIFRRAFRSGDDGLDHDAAELVLNSPRLAFTTDSFVVRPLFFPGGDIGSLAVHGTVNDLAMSGAEPLVLSAGFILEDSQCSDFLSEPLDVLVRIPILDTHKHQKAFADLTDHPPTGFDLSPRHTLNHSSHIKLHLAQ